jgi:hypothetical protein
LALNIQHSTSGWGFKEKKAGGKRCSAQKTLRDRAQSVRFHDIHLRRHYPDQVTGFRRLRSLKGAPPSLSRVYPAPLLKFFSRLKTF